MAAAVHAHVAARIEGAALRLDVEDPGGAQPVLGGQRAGEQGDRAGQARAQAAGLGEQGRALRQHDAVDAVLHVAHLLAHVNAARARGILRDTRRLQQHPRQRIVLAAGLVLDRLTADLVGRRADARLHLDPLFFQPLGRHAHVERQPRGESQIDARALRVGHGHARGRRLETFTLRHHRVPARRDPGEGEAPLIVGGHPVRHAPVARLESHARGRERALERVLDDPGHLAGRRRRRHDRGGDRDQQRPDRRSGPPAHERPREALR